MAAPPSPRPPQAPSAGGDAPVSLFLDTDLGTRLALRVDPHATVRHLKSQVAAEHAAAFPDLGTVAVKSFQVRRKRALYHLSDSMTVTSAFTRINGGCFLHVKMAAEAATTHCCQDAPAIDGTRLSQGFLGIHVEKSVRGLPAMISEIASDVLPQGPEGGGGGGGGGAAAAAAAVLDNLHAHDTVPNDVVLPSSSQMNTEINKSGAVSLVSDTQAGSGPVIDKTTSSDCQLKHDNQTEGAYINFTSMANVDGSSNWRNVSHVVEEVHARKEDNLHCHGDQAAAAGVFDNRQVSIEEGMLKDIKAVDDLSQEKEQKKPKRSGSFDTSAVDPIRVTTESSTRDSTKSNRLPLEMSTIFRGDGDQSNIYFKQEDPAQLENPSTVGKKKKKKRQLLPSEALPAQEMTEPFTGAVELSKAAGEPSTDPISAINSTSEVVANEGKTTKGNNTSLDRGDNHEIKQLEHQEGSHDVGVVETNNMGNDSKITDTLEKRHTDDKPSQGKKRKKTKKVSSVDMASVEAPREKGMHGSRENAAKLDLVSTEREIVDDPSMRQSNMQEGGSNIIESPTGDGKRKKRRKRHSESLKGVDPTQDLMKSSAFATNESLIQNTNAAPLGAKQTIGDAIEGTKIFDEHKKLDESLNRAVTDVIDEVLADLRSTERLSMDLDGDVVTGKTQLTGSLNAPELPKSTEVKVGVGAALPPKYPAAVHSDAPVGSPSHKKSKGKQMKALSAMLDPSHYPSTVPQEGANTESRDLDSLRLSEKTTSLMDATAEDVVVQAGGKTKSTKRQRKKVSGKQGTTENGTDTQSCDKVVPSSDVQIPVATDDLNGPHTTQANLVAGDSVNDTRSSTVGKIQQKGKRPSKTGTHKVQETDVSIHEQESHEKHVNDTAGTHDSENAGASSGSPRVQKDNTTLNSASPNAGKGRKKSLNTELQIRDSGIRHGSNADLMNSRADQGMVSPKNSADAIETNCHIAANPVSDEINFLDHFSSKTNDPSVSAENKQNNEEAKREVKNKKNKSKHGTGSVEPNDIPEHLPPAGRTTLTNHLGGGEVAVPSVLAENIDKEDGNPKKIEKKRRKRKPNLEEPAAGKENPSCDYQGTDISTQESLHSVVQKGTIDQDNGKENHAKLNHNASMMPQEPPDAICGSTLGKNFYQGQNNVTIDGSHADAHMGTMKSTSQKKTLAKSGNNDEAANGRAGLNHAVSNLVKSFSMSPPASSDSEEATPQQANRYRVAVRKIPSNRCEKNTDKYKKASKKVGSSTIFNDTISDETDNALDAKSGKDAITALQDNSSSSADSGISSAAYDGSEFTDDDGIVSLSQKSLNGGLHLGSILRGSSSYKKARQRQMEELDDVTEVPDSQPADGL
ncbi:hypothetical protein ACP4OV_031277 [Aristida adscensionis]